MFSLVFGSQAPHANALGVHYAKYLLKNLYTTVTRYVISMYTLCGLQE